MRVALYARVSKNDASQDPENQLMRLRSYALEHQFEVYGEFVDLASGADANRPELKRMLNLAKGHQFSKVLAVKYDRVARSVIDLETIHKTLDQYGIKLDCIDEPISAETPEGTAFRQMLGVMAELERGLIRNRTKAGLERAKANGKVLGRPPIRIDMTRVQQLRAEGVGLRAIAVELGVSHQTIRSRLKNEGVNGSNESL